KGDAPRPSEPGPFRKAQSKCKTTGGRISTIMLLLVVQAIGRPGHSFQPGWLNLAAAIHALAKCPLVYTLESLLYLAERPGNQGVLFERSRLALRRRGLVSEIFHALWGP